LKENTNKLIETFNLSEIQITEIKDKKNFLKIFVIEMLTALVITITILLKKTLKLIQKQLLTLS
jgi:hypothetical protein